MNRFFSIFFLFLVLSSSVYAFDCNIFDRIDKENCKFLLEHSPSLIGNLIYSDSFYPNHNFVKNYNDGVEVDNPFNITKESGVIKSAWLIQTDIYPSVQSDYGLLVSDRVNVRSKYGYNIKLPENYESHKEKDGSTCKRTYSLKSQTEKLETLVGSKLYSSSSNLPVYSEGYVKSRLTIEAKYLEKRYEWEKHKRCDSSGSCYTWYTCDYDRSRTYTDRLVLEDSRYAHLYSKEPSADLVFISEYYDTIKGNITKGNDTNLFLSFESSSYLDTDLEFNAILSPYGFLQITVKNSTHKKIENMKVIGDTFYLSDRSNCKLTYSGMFSYTEEECPTDFVGENVEAIKKIEFSGDWYLLLKLGIFVLVVYFIYLAIKKSFGKYMFQ